MQSEPINFCTQCGHAVDLTIPVGDNRPRFVCRQCGAIHYQNPKVVAGCIPVCNGKILLCKRAIEPRRGFWTLPAGFLENGETLEQGMARETLEEAGAAIVDSQLYGIYSLPKRNQVYVMYRARLAKPNGFYVGEESLEVALFENHQIPWDEIAFRVIDLTLRRFLSESRSGRFTVEVRDIL